MKTIITAAVALALSSTVFAANVSMQAISEYEKSDAACKSKIDKSLSPSLQFSQSFACAAVAGDLRDDISFGHILRTAAATGKTTAKDFDKLFSETSVRAALIVDGKIETVSSFTPNPVQPEDIIKGGNFRYENNGIVYHARIIHVDAGNGKVIAGIVPRDSGAEAARRYEQVAKDDANRAAGAAAKAAEKAGK